MIKVLEAWEMMHGKKALLSSDVYKLSVICKTELVDKDISVHAKKTEIGKILTQHANDQTPFKIGNDIYTIQLAPANGCMKYKLLIKGEKLVIGEKKIIPGYIYFLQYLDPHASIVKVGISKESSRGLNRKPIGRGKGHQTSCPYNLNLIDEIDCKLLSKARGIENFVKRDWDEYRTTKRNTEWFFRTTIQADELIEYIESRFDEIDEYYVRDQYRIFAPPILKFYKKKKEPTHHVISREGQEYITDCPTKLGREIGAIGSLLSMSTRTVRPNTEGFRVERITNELT